MGRHKVLVLIIVVHFVGIVAACSGSDPSASDLRVIIEKSVDRLEKEGRLSPDLIEIQNVEITGLKDMLGTVQEDGSVVHDPGTARLVEVEFEVEVKYLDMCYRWKSNMLNCQIDYKKYKLGNSHEDRMLAQNIGTVPKDTIELGRGKVFLGEGESGWASWYQLNYIKMVKRKFARYDW